MTDPHNYEDICKSWLAGGYQDDPEIWRKSVQQELAETSDRTLTADVLDGWFDQDTGIPQPDSDKLTTMFGKLRISFPEWFDAA